MFHSVLLSSIIHTIRLIGGTQHRNQVIIQTEHYKVGKELDPAAKRRSVTASLRCSRFFAFNGKKDIPRKRCPFPEDPGVLAGNSIGMAMTNGYCVGKYLGEK
jgi:hypothetical protein